MPTGLNQEIPWYAAIGNHDHFWIGSKTINGHLKSAMTGENILQTGNIITDPNAMDKMTYSIGTIDRSTLYHTISTIYGKSTDFCIIACSFSYLYTVNIEPRTKNQEPGINLPVATACRRGTRTFTK